MQELRLAPADESHGAGFATIRPRAKILSSSPRASSSAATQATLRTLNTVFTPPHPHHTHRLSRRRERGSTRRGGSSSSSRQARSGSKAGSHGRGQQRQHRPGGRRAGLVLRHRLPRPPQLLRLGLVLGRRQQWQPPVRYGHQEGVGQAQGRRHRRQEVVAPGREGRRQPRQPRVAGRIAARRLRLRPSGTGQGPQRAQVVQGSRAHPRAMGAGGRGGHLRGTGVERRAMVRGRRCPGRRRALLLRRAAGHAAAAHGVGGGQAVGGLPGAQLAGRGMGHPVVKDRRELLQFHGPARLPRRLLLRPLEAGGIRPGRQVRGGLPKAGAAAAGGDQARQDRHARHAHLLLRGRAGIDAPRRHWVVGLC